MPLTIRQEQSQDYAVVHQLNKEAFDQENEAKLVDALRSSESFIPELSLVAKLDKVIVGHILFTKIKIVEGTKVSESLALAPMAVAKSFQKQGIGGKLIKAGLKRAMELGYTSVIVLGHAEYYTRFGFEPTTKWNIRAPFDVPAEVFMGIELIPNALTNSSGIVQYPKEFESV